VAETEKGIFQAARVDDAMSCRWCRLVLEASSSEQTIRSTVIMTTNWASRSLCNDISTPFMEPIGFAHPRYPSHVFLRLEPCDMKDNVSGVLLEVALYACRIIANNQCGFLSTSNNATDKVNHTPGTDVLLSRARYYYFLGTKLPG